VAGWYALAAGAWILLSDRLLEWIDIGDSQAAATAKGLLFVAVTAGLLFSFLRRLAQQLVRAQEKQRESEVRWQFALEAAGDGVWDWDLMSGAAYFSARCQQMLGFSATELEGRIDNWLDRIHPDDREAVTAAMDRHFLGQTAAWVTEHRVRRKSGDYQWILTRGKVVERTTYGAPRRMLGVATDVTQRRKAEARLEAALAFARTVLQSSPVGLLTYHVDGSAISANPAAARILGLTMEELNDCPFAQLPPWSATGPAVPAERICSDGGELEQTVDWRRGDGRRSRLALRLVPFRHQGEPRLLVVVQDETEKHQVLRELHLTRAALQAAPTAWVITDARGLVEWVNPAFTRLTGYEFAEVAGQSLRVLRSGRHPADYYANLWSTIMRGEVWEGDMHNRRKDGTLYHEHMVIAPVREPGGGITHFVAMKQDITAERELEGQLARAQRLESIGMLASGIAHDLNNVLSPILLSMELIRMKVDRPDLLPALEVVEQSAQRGAGIVRQVLTFARGLDGAKGEVAARHVLREASRLIEETFPRNITVRLQAARDLGAINGDPTQLHQVLLNLAVNARDAMPEGGTITLRGANVEVDEARARRSPGLTVGPHVALSVVDTGTGIPPEVLEHIFEPFFTTKPRGKGTGLGLSTVHGIVRNHGGIIDVVSSVGHGSEFTVLLPRLRETGGAKSAAPTAEAAPVAFGRGRRVLVVDDEQLILDVVAGVLRRQGFDVRGARDGVEALALFESTGPWSLMIVDRMMPRLDGLALARAVRARDRALPLMVMTGLVREPEAEADPAAALAALDVHVILEKPFGEAQLMEAVRRLLPDVESE
jgi:PAS domain S-box-containing protein